MNCKKYFAHKHCVPKGAPSTNYAMPKSQHFWEKWKDEAVDDEMDLQNKQTKNKNKNMPYQPSIEFELQSF